MNKVGPILLLIALMAGTASLLSEAGVLPVQITKIFGPFVILCIALWVYFTRKDDIPQGRALIIAALFMSFIADFMLNQVGFIPGLVVFLMAHIIYIILLSMRGGWSRHILPFVIGYGVIAAVVVSMIWPFIVTDGPVLTLAVIIYVLVITTMASLAGSVALRTRSSLAIMAAIGAALFFISDASIALNAFGDQLPVPAWILIVPTYWLAQYLIASSLPPRKA